jgi:hypothetical protein
MSKCNSWVGISLQIYLSPPPEIQLPQFQHEGLGIENERTAASFTRQLWGTYEKYEPIAHSGRAGAARTPSECQTSVCQGEHKYCVVQCHLLCNSQLRLSKINTKTENPLHEKCGR